MLDDFTGESLGEVIYGLTGADDQRAVQVIIDDLIARMPDGPYETPPRNKLALGVIYRAVKELKEGTGGQDPSGPDVVIINHSICDEAFGFAGNISP